MATRIIEYLIIDNEDPHVVTNWIERFECAIEIALFSNVDKLPTEDDAKTAKIMEMKRTYLLSCLGASTYKLLKSYCIPQTPTEKSYDDLIKVLKEKLSPGTNVVSEQYKFNQIKQESTETLSNFMARIKESAAACSFEGQFDSMVRNRFITGLRDDRIRTSLLSEATSTTTSEQIYEKALVKQRANQSSKDMNNVNSVRYSNSSNKSRGGRASSSSNQRNPMSQKPTHGKQEADGRTLVCEQCTLRGHRKSECYTQCRYCKKRGHIAKNCQKKMKKSTHHVDHDATGSSEYGYTEEDSQQIYHVSDIVSKCLVYNDTIGDKGTHTGCGFDKACNCNELIPFENLLENRPDKGCNVKFTNNIVDSENPTLVDYPIEISSICSNVINTINSSRSKPFLNVTVNECNLKMELDTGSSLSCISSDKFDRLDLKCAIIPCNEKLCVANYQYETASRKAIVNVQFKGNSWTLPLFVVDCQFPTLLGRDWISKIFGADWLDRFMDQIPVNQTNLVRSRSSFIEEIKRSEVFDPGVGEVIGYEAALDLKPDSKPKFCKARPVPFALKEKLDATIDKLVKSGQWVQVNHSHYASPIVPIVKEDGTIRVCGDYKCTLNPNLDTEIYPLPTLEDCFSPLAGGELFSKLDIKQAYNSLKLRPSDQKLATVNTHKGLFVPTRLPYGVSSAGAIFQRKMDQILGNLDGVVCRVDDIAITGPNDEEHMKRLEEVIRRLETAGFRCRKDKCVFMVESIVFLGYEISKHGIKPKRCKVETLQKAPYPENQSQLISFLGAVQYYSRHIPNMSTLIEPLNKLRSTQTPWRFGDAEKRAFDELKKILSSDRVLTFYDPKLPVKLDTDSSSFGIGGVLSHVMPDDSEKVIEMVSRTLSQAERNYSQVEKEALGIVWSIKRFHRYLYGRPFTLVTDHKPLETIFHPNKGIPQMGISRIIRWSIFLSSYQYQIKFRPTGSHGNADMCSRFPLKNTESEDDDSCYLHGEEEAVKSVFSVHKVGDQVDRPLLDADRVAKFTRNDVILSKVTHMLKDGWNDKELSDKIKPFKDRKSELSVDNGCVLWGSRVVIPEKLRADILDLLHSTHMGMVSMKSLARCYVWWPGLDAEIERTVRECEVCQMNQRKPPKSIPHPWVKPSEPWERIHLDFCGPFLGLMWMVVICAKTKWIEILKMPNTKSPAVIRELRVLFSRFGIPRVVVSDNGPQLTSDLMKDFMTKNGVKHIFIASYHPASNGAAEGLVGKFKSAMKRMVMRNPDIMCNLANWLMAHRNTPHPTTGLEPSVAMLGRRARSAISLVHPLNSSKRQDKLIDYEQTVIDKESRARTFDVGEKVLFYDEHQKKWKPGFVTKPLGSKMFQIQSELGEERKHLDQMVKNTIKDVKADEEPNREKPEDSGKAVVGSNGVGPVVEHGTKVANPNKFNLETPSASSNIRNNQVPVPTGEPNIELQTPPSTSLRSSLRNVKQPDRLSYSKLGG